MNSETGNTYGRQYKDDIPFTRKARLLQSFFRVKTLKEREFGIGPNKNRQGKSCNQIKRT